MTTPKTDDVKWISVSDVDRERRTPQDWARIYMIKLRSDPPTGKVSEYEWAYLLDKIKFFPNAIPDTPSYDKFEEMIYRADELRRDLFIGAEPYERALLNEKYVETRWVHDRLRF